METRNGRRGLAALMPNKRVQLVQAPSKVGRPQQVRQKPRQGDESGDRRERNTQPEDLTTATNRQLRVCLPQYTVARYTWLGSILIYLYSFVYLSDSAIVNQSRQLIQSRVAEVAVFATIAPGLMHLVLL